VPGRMESRRRRAVGSSLPILANGQSATVTIPENSFPNHWRGKFVARQYCSGASGSTFHCLVGDCGVTR